MKKAWIRGAALLCIASASASAFAWQTFDSVRTDRAIHLRIKDTLTIPNVGDPSSGWRSYDVPANERVFFGQLTLMRTTETLPSAVWFVRDIVPASGSLQLRSGTVQASSGWLQLTGGQVQLSDGLLFPIGSNVLTLVSSRTEPESYPMLNVPEPETYALLLAGLGLLGVVSRSRRRQSDSA